MRSDARNLQAIVEKINRHNLSCPFPATAVAMNPFEADRLGWDEIKGLPIVADSKLGTGMFRIICDRDKKLADEADALIVDSVNRELIAA